MTAIYYLEINSDLFAINLAYNILIKIENQNYNYYLSIISVLSVIDMYCVVRPVWDCVCFCNWLSFTYAVYYHDTE